MPPAKNTAMSVAAPAGLSPEDLQALLQQSGMLSAPSTSYRRLKMDGGTLIALDAQGEAQEQFPPRFDGKEPLPAVTLRIVEPPFYYNAMWLGAETDERGKPTGALDPNRINRPDLNKSFSKRYDDPARQQADTSPANEVYDQLVTASGKRGDFRGDLRVQIVPASGEMTGNETVYTLSLSASACLDFRGTSKNPMGGVVQEKNFIVQLSELAIGLAAENGKDPRTAVLDAMTALRLGGVVADVYLLRAQNDDKTMTWTIPAFRPVHIEFTDAVPELPADTSDIGF